MWLKVLYFVLLLLLAPLLLAFTREGVQFLVAVWALGAVKWFLLGAALATLYYILTRKRENDFVQILLHEMEHAAMAFLFTGHWPQKMEIEPPEGKTVTGSGCFLSWLTPLRPLAPYFLPLLTIPFLLLKALAALAFLVLKTPFPSLLAAALDLLIGATLTLHTLYTVKEFRPSVQTDIKKAGLFVSLVTVAFLIFLSVVISIAVVTGGYAEFWAYVKTALMAAWELYQEAYAWLKVHLPPALQALRKGLKDLL
jgi:hypothetical protein